MRCSEQSAIQGTGVAGSGGPPRFTTVGGNDAAAVAEVRPRGYRGQTEENGLRTATGSMFMLDYGTFYASKTFEIPAATTYCIFVAMFHPKQVHCEGFWLKKRPFNVKSAVVLQPLTVGLILLLAMPLVV